MEPLSVIPEQEDIIHYARADTDDAPSERRSESVPPPDLNVFAARPAKRFKLSHHELAPLRVAAPLRPRYIVSRQALDEEDARHMHFGELETHEHTARNHDETLLVVMADCGFDPRESVVYYELETKSESLVASMAIERRYVGLELIGGAARDAAAVHRAAATSQPYDPAVDTRADSRYPLALKSRFLQAPLNAYEWAVRRQELRGDVGAPCATATPMTNAWHRIGLLVDRTNGTVSATRDGQLVATASIGADAAHLNCDIGLVPVFALAPHGSARAVFGRADAENSTFKFDVAGYLVQRQREIAAHIAREVDPGVPMDFFSEYFQYYGYEQAARACARGALLRNSVALRSRLRRAVMAGDARAVPELLRGVVDTASRPALQQCIRRQSAQEVALKHLLANTVPDAQEMLLVNTREAAALLIAPENTQARAAAVARCTQSRIDVLDSVLAEVTTALHESFSSPAFRTQTPVLRDLAKSFHTNIVAKSTEKNGTYVLLRGYLQHEYGSDFAGPST